MDFIKLFSDVKVSPVMLVTKVEDVKLSTSTGTLKVKLSIPYEFTDEDKNIIENSLLKAYPVNKLEVEYKVHNEKKESPVICGANLKDEVLEKIKNIDQYYGEVTIEGKIIATDERETKKGNILFKFDITDKTSSISCKMISSNRAYSKDIISKNDLKEKVIPRVKKGAYVRVKGNASFDTFDNEVNIMANSIMVADEPKKLDTYPEKRVELHLHTKMSAMDALIEVDDVVKRASEWGHKAIAITDHGVVQAYPDAQDAGKKYGVKILYGIECYLIDDAINIVSKEDNSSFADDFVVFDIVATGNSPVTNHMLQISAARISDGQPVEYFDKYVKAPESAITSGVTETTGITYETVKNADDVETAVKEFLVFAGNTPVITFNSNLNTGFIKYHAANMGKVFENTVLDLQELSKATFTDIKKFSLTAVAKQAGIVLEGFHRGNEYVGIYLKIFSKLVDILSLNGVTALNQINSHFKCDDHTKMGYYHAIILVKTQTGMKNLYKIISDSHLKYFYKKPRVPRRILQQYREGLVVGSACEAGELYRHMLAGATQEELKQIASFYDYLEIQPLGNNRFMMDNGTVETIEQLQDFNIRIVDLAKELNLPYVATCDAHFLDAEDSIYRAIIMAGQKYKDADNQAPLYFRTTDEMMEEFSYLDEETRYNAVVKYPNEIADMLEADLNPIPKETYPPKIDGAEDDVRNISYATARKIYGDELPDLVKDRMEKELNSIINNGFSVMYVIAQKLVWKSLEDGYLVGSRGSVGSSFIAFLMKITEVNALCPHYICPKCKHNKFFERGEYPCGIDLPDKDCPVCGTKMTKDGHDIPFETFLGFHGEKDPDIDLNFSGEYQSRAHKYTEEIFGSDHVFKAGTISTLADKTAYGYVMNYLSERNMVVSNAEKNRLTLGCAGVKKTTGQHPGGMVVVPDDMDIYDFCPIHNPADKEGADFVTTHFDYSKMKGRLLKFDILGHDDPTTLKILGDITGVDVQKIPLDDPDVMSIFNSNTAMKYLPEYYDEEFIDKVATNGIPEFGTPFTKQMLLDTLPTTFSELIRLSGLSHGTDVWLNNAQDLVREGTATLPEVICTRDDIMVYLMHMGMDSKDAFDIMEFTRKGKFSQHQDLIPKMREKNVPEWYIESCLKIKYMFPKAHAAAYVTMAFRIAWFKVHMPKAYYIAYFTRKADAFDSTIMTKGIHKTRELIRNLRNSEEKLSVKDKDILMLLEVCNEMYSRGFNFSKVDLYKSHATMFSEGEDGGILPPLSAMAGLGESAAIAIANEREKGPFTSVDDLRTRTAINKTAMEVLRTEGCLDGMKESAQITLFN